MGCPVTDIHATGPECVKGRTNNVATRNLKSAFERPDIVTEHIQKELESGRIASSFTSPPFQTFLCSPVGLVEQKVKGNLRMIHHLSHPEGSSVNDQIDESWSSVHYADIGDAIDLVNYIFPQAFMAKTDVKTAFRIIPLHPEVRNLFVFQWDDLFYVDLALPMGCSSSCQIFESLSTAIQWTAENKLNIRLVHILDDFFIASISEEAGKNQLASFLNMCADIGLPMAPDKTFGPATIMSFVGYEIDTVRKEVRLPVDKVQKCKEEIQMLLQHKKATLKQIQSVLGLLNFACVVVKPGRRFLRRLIDLTVGVRAAHFFISLTRAVKDYLDMWHQFLEQFNGRSLFLDEHFISNHVLELYTDTSGSLGYGAVFGKEWFNGVWWDWWRGKNITLLELYPIVVAMDVWDHKLQQKQLILHTDNEAIVSVLLKQTSKEPLVMILVCRLVLQCLRCNVVLEARHIKGTKNVSADALSRLQMARFHASNPAANLCPTPIPPLPQQL